MEIAKQTIHTQEDIGRTIRLLRQGRRLTGVELGERVGLSQSKISKIETGVTKPSLLETEKILNILHCPKLIRQRIIAVLELDAELPNSKYGSYPSTPNTVLKRELATAHLRCVALHAVPALLQITVYREALLSSYEIGARWGLAQIMNETMRRQDLLWDKEHTFHFIMHEATLYTAPASREVQLAQLDRLERLCGVRRIKIGIVPLQAGLLTTAITSFAIYDTCLVVQALGWRELASDDPQDITEHVKIFNDLNKKACYEDEAKSLIRKAAEFFA